MELVTVTQTADNVARWFLQTNKLDRADNIDVEGISNLKLQKLLYYAYGGYLALYNQHLFNEPIVAWQHGPVVENVYRQYRAYGSHSIDKFDAPETTFTQEEVGVLKWVYEEFGQYTAWALRNKTHEEEPWRTTAPNQQIQDDVIMSYFKDHYVEA